MDVFSSLPGQQALVYHPVRDIWLYLLAAAVLLALAVPIDMLISAAGHARWVTNPQADPFPVLPMAFLVGGMTWFGIFFGLRVFNLRELAEATVTRDMNDCLIVTDAQDYIVELNPAAEELFGERAAAMTGSLAAAAFAPWPALAGLAAVAYGDDLKESWLEFALGLTAKLDKKVDGYLEVTRTTGDKAKTPWQVNVGARWNF